VSLTVRVLIALALGLGAGIALAAHPVPSLVALANAIEPIGVLWVNAIRMTVVPLVVSLLITGVTAADDARAVGRVGARSIATFAGLLVFAGIFALVVVPVAFSWLHIDPVAAAALRATTASGATPVPVPGFAQWIVDVVPTNPIRAAADGAMLPLVVFTIAFALALLRLPAERRAGVAGFFRGVGDAMLVLVRWIIALAPIGVFALMLPVASRTGAAAAGALGYYVVALSAVSVALALLLYPLTAIAARVPIRRFARAVFPAQAVAFSSSSSLASLPALIDGAERRLDLPPSVTGVALPLAVSTFKIGSPLTWSVAATFLAQFYGVPLTPASRVFIAVTALLTSFSVPGVPHGWLLVIAPLLASVGIPAEGIGLLIAVDAIPDVFMTTLNVTADMSAAAIVARGAEAEAPDALGASARVIAVAPGD
jgi:Na+/H+-dicarboxylate symporter